MSRPCSQAYTFFLLAVCYSTLVSGIVSSAASGVRIPHNSLGEGRKDGGKGNKEERKREVKNGERGERLIECLTD